MKKIVVGMLACAGMLAASTISFGVTGKVNTDTARVRSEASASSSIIDLLSIDDKVEVIEESGEWYKIKLNDKTGYISKSLLDVDKAVEAKETDTSNKETETANTTTSEKSEEKEDTTEAETKEEENATETPTTEAELTITESFVGKLSSEISIKILPSINSMEVTKVTKDTEITVVEIINDWCHIETSTYTGWIRIKLLKDAVKVADAEKSEEPTTEDAKTEEPETTEPETQTKKGYVNVETVNLRKDKSTSSEKIDSITKNTEVTILGEEDGWYKVKVGNLTGYISKKYISDKKVEEVTSRASDTARQIQESKTTEQTDTNTSSAVASTAAPTAAPTGSKGSDVVSFAKQYLGYKYVAGGASPSTGFDCSGFTSYVYKNFGVSLNRTSSGQRSNGVAVDKSNLQPGDIVCFSGHVGLYIGNNQFIHASNPKGGVKINSLSDSYYVKNYITSRRVID